MRRRLAYVLLANEWDSITAKVAVAEKRMQCLTLKRRREFISSLRKQEEMKGEWRLMPNFEIRMIKE